jgi:hypothetical protein
MKFVFLPPFFWLFSGSSKRCRIICSHKKGVLDMGGAAAPPYRLGREGLFSLRLPDPADFARADS